MKRCPECDFIYEDDQGLCDMDGKELVYDPRISILLANSPDKAEIGPQGLHPKWLSSGGFAAVLLTGVVLAAVLFAVYHASPRALQSQPENQSRKPETPDWKPGDKNPNLPSSRPSASPATARPAPSPDSSPTQSNVRVGRSPAGILKSEPVRPRSPAPKPEVDKPKSVSPSGASGNQKPETANREDKSKLGALLKKTKRILKKPFKL